MCFLPFSLPLSLSPVPKSNVDQESRMHPYHSCITVFGSENLAHIVVLSTPSPWFVRFSFVHFSIENSFKTSLKNLVQISPYLTE